MPNPLTINLPGCSMEVFADSAQAVISLVYTPAFASPPQTSGNSPIDMFLAYQATRAQYPIGSLWVWGGLLQGAPDGSVAYPFKNITGGDTSQWHQLRVTDIHPKPVAGQTFIDVVYRSRPRPSIEYDSSLTQNTVETYLTGVQAAIYTRSQMVVNWTAPASYPTNILKSPVPYPAVPASDNVLRFGASIKVSATFYANELSLAAMHKFRGNYSNCVNAFSLVFDGDSALWLCTNTPIYSPDGGYTNRLSMEFVYSVDGWDSIEIYEDPVSESSVVLDQSVVDKLYAPLRTGGLGSNPVPSPFNANGASRFPQHPSVDFAPILSLLLSNKPPLGVINL